MSLEEVDEPEVEEKVHAKCLNQVFRPKNYVKVPGYGNCLICQTDKKNILCEGVYSL